MQCCCSALFSQPPACDGHRDARQRMAGTAGSPALRELAAVGIELQHPRCCCHPAPAQYDLEHFGGGDSRAELARHGCRRSAALRHVHAIRSHEIGALQECGCEPDEQAQAVLIALLSVPFVMVFINSHGGIGAFEIAGAVLWLAAIAGESLADAQLNRFRADPSNKGKTCRVGLWKFSRHPNYFCEWLVWVAYFVYALGSPGGWMAVYAPALMYLFLTRITGIKATEEHAVRSRGEEYLEYQRTTNAFFPWWPRN